MAETNLDSNELTLLVKNVVFDLEKFNDLYKQKCLELSQTRRHVQRAEQDMKRDIAAEEQDVGILLKELHDVETESQKERRKLEVELAELKFDTEMAQQMIMAYGKLMGEKVLRIVRDSEIFDKLVEEEKKKKKLKEELEVNLVSMMKGRRRLMKETAFLYSSVRESLDTRDMIKLFVEDSDGSAPVSDQIGSNAVLKKRIGELQVEFTALCVKEEFLESKNVAVREKMQAIEANDFHTIEEKGRTILEELQAACVSSTEALRECVKVADRVFGLAVQKNEFRAETVSLTESPKKDSVNFELFENTLRPHIEGEEVSFSLPDLRSDELVSSVGLQESPFALIADCADIGSTGNKNPKIQGDCGDAHPLNEDYELVIPPEIKLEVIDKTQIGGL